MLLKGAVLGKAALGNSALVGELIDYFDTGKTLAAASASNEAYVNLIYRGVMGQEASPQTTAALAGLISSGTYTQAGFLATAAELPLIQINVDLVGLQQTGIVNL